MFNFRVLFNGESESIASHRVGCARTYTQNLRQANGRDYEVLGVAFIAVHNSNMFEVDGIRIKVNLLYCIIIVLS